MDNSNLKENNKKNLPKKSNPNYRNKFYEMQDLVKEKAKLKEELKKYETEISNFNNNTNSNSNSNKIHLLSNFKNENEEKNNEKHYKPEERTENLFIKSSNQIMKNRFMKNIFSKRRILNILGIPINNDQIKTYARNWKMFDSLMILSNFFIMIFAFIDYEINFTYPRTEIPKNYLFRYLMSIISFFAILCVVLRHYYKLKWNNWKFYEGNVNNYYSEPEELEDEWFIDGQINLIDNRFRKFIKLGLFIDILVNLLVPNPFFNFIIKSIEMDRDKNEYIIIDYLYSDIIFIFIILRIIYLIRATVNYSIFTDEYAQELSKKNGIKSNVRFALKCLFKTYDIKFVIVFFFISNVILGFVLRVFERPFWVYKEKNELEYISNSFWLIFITMLTIGFGEFVPYSFGGRIICMIAGLWGIFICSLFTVSLFGLFDLSKDQFSVFVKVIKGRTAINFIENAYLYRKNNKDKTNSKKNSNPKKSEYDEMLKAFISFKKMRNESDNIYRSNGNLFYNNRLMKEIKKVSFKFDKIEKDMEFINNNITGKNNKFNNKNIDKNYDYNDNKNDNEFNALDLNSEKDIEINENKSNIKLIKKN
jgi:hypothetical protein